MAPQRALPDNRGTFAPPVAAPSRPGGTGVGPARRSRVRPLRGRRGHAPYAAAMAQNTLVARATPTARAGRVAGTTPAARPTPSAPGAPSGQEADTAPAARGARRDGAAGPRKVAVVTGAGSVSAGRSPRRWPPPNGRWCWPAGVRRPWRKRPGAGPRRRRQPRCRGGADRRHAPRRGRRALRRSPRPLRPPGPALQQRGHLRPGRAPGRTDLRRTGGRSSTSTSPAPSSARRPRSA